MNYFMIRVGSHTCSEKDYLEARHEHVKECLVNDKWINVSTNDYFTLIHNLSNKYHQVFMYHDEYGYQRYYTVHTYLTQKQQASALGQYESLAYHSDINGTALCEDAYPFNNGTVNNTGEDLKETHYATVYDLRHASRYFWDNNDSDDEY
ncbi:hypothetical protein Klosneuvirus_4_122 [Klosneuvirus KNV1]|uniref:Uncharacterized protein n=1 Tax=Klosneuvirus KNV1 TaxID=1977640 RepID=A0A1V0SKQ3_9VIRU|nr:hypothetical protein Klosneuvirus_4_122 [Klosneuvirus KNV1]